MYADLRDWLEQVDGFGELVKVQGAHWDKEMGAITQLAHEDNPHNPPALLFDEVPGYPQGYRTLYGTLSSPKRFALTCGLEIKDYTSKVELLRNYRRKIACMKLIKPQLVSDGPVMENVHTGNDINVLEFPVPIHHEQDITRFVATASAVITKDPDQDWFNIGTYRCMVHDEKNIGLQITKGKHGRIHMDKYFERNQPMKVAVCVGQDPLLYLLGCTPAPIGVSEYEIIGGLRNEAVKVITGPYTGFPIPAAADIVIEGIVHPDKTKPEGPFGEWMGYYSTDVQPRPYIEIKTILHRNNPILMCAPQHRPPDETLLLKQIGVGAETWDAMEKFGVQEITGLWQHSGGAGTKFLVISINQRYPGHARHAALAAAASPGVAYNGKWVVVVDDDIDPSNEVQVMWALSTRVNATEDLDIIKHAWSSGRDPMEGSVNFGYSTRVLVDATIPFHRKSRNEFPEVVKVSDRMTETLRRKYPFLRRS